MSFLTNNHGFSFYWLNQKSCDILTTIVGSYSFVITDTEGIQYSRYINISQHTTASGSKIIWEKNIFANLGKWSSLLKRGTERLSESGRHQSRYIIEYNINGHDIEAYNLHFFAIANNHTPQVHVRGKISLLVFLVGFDIGYC